MARATPRIRHCAECPKCLTRYVVAFSPYRNGSRLLPVVAGGSDEYILYCACGTPFTASRWHWREFKACTVFTSAYERGYGTADEIVPMHIELANAGGIEKKRQSGPSFVRQNRLRF